jgi:hypothetical protein
MEPRVPAALPQQQQQTTRQSVWAPNVNSLPLVKILQLVGTVVQQIMTEFNGTVLEEAKTVSITESVLNLTKQNGH